MGTTAAYKNPFLTMRGMNPLYPCSDGKPMAENDTQGRWITTVRANLDRIFLHRPDVYVSHDTLVYPVAGHPEICTAPDVYVVFGRPKEERGSYIVHEENGVFPQVVWEIRSPSNTAGEMARKLVFYTQYGADEYYDYDPARNRLRGYVRAGAGLDPVPDLNGFVSPRLGVRFDTSGPELVLHRPDGQRFLTMVEMTVELDEARADAVEAQRVADDSRRELVVAQREVVAARRELTDAQRVAADAQRVADAEKAKNDRLQAMVRAAGLDPDAP